jgi:hypothetical protein
MPETITAIQSRVKRGKIDISGVTLISGNQYTIHVIEAESCFGMCYNWGMDTGGNNYAGGLFCYVGTS